MINFNLLGLPENPKEFEISNKATSYPLILKTNGKELRLVLLKPSESVLEIDNNYCSTNEQFPHFAQLTIYDYGINLLFPGTYTSFKKYLFSASESFLNDFNQKISEKEFINISPEEFITLVSGKLTNVGLLGKNNDPNPYSPTFLEDDSESSSLSLVLDGDFSPEIEDHELKAIEIYRHNEQQFFSYEGSFYYFYNETPGSELIPSNPIGISEFDDETNNYSSLSIYNDWPIVENKNILNFFKPGDNSEFSQYIRKWYKCSCAIVYEHPNHERKILGSGNLINENTVYTARHNYQNYPNNSLYIRFYNYNIENIRNDDFRVDVEYIDIPVVDRENGANGLDMGKLTIPSINQDLFNKYLQVLAPAEDLGLPTGHFLMFHFADGIHQVSTGEIPSDSPYELLQNSIFIQAGPGASGASIIWQGLENDPAGYAISNYRDFDANRTAERRVIPYSEFQNGGTIEPIKNPYHETSGEFQLPIEAINPFSYNGYEFLLWNQAHYRDIRPDKPKKNPLYHVASHQSDHHIIPISDLLYLWDYFFELEGTIITKINDDVNTHIEGWKQSRIGDIEEEIESLNDAFEDEALRNIEKRKIEDAFALKMKNEADEKFKQFKKNKISVEYDKFHALLRKLCIHTNNTQIDSIRSEFSWGLWNLFVGPNRSFRKDDPSRSADKVYRNEKIRPLGFDSAHWNAVYNLFIAIQELKELNAYDATVVDGKESNVENALQAMINYWNSLPQANRKMYAHDPNDWENIPENGVMMYRLKLTPNVKLTMQLPHNKNPNTSYYLVGTFNNWLGAKHYPNEPARSGNIAPLPTDREIWTLKIPSQNVLNTLEGEFDLPPDKDVHFKVIAYEEDTHQRKWLPNEKYGENYQYDEKIRTPTPSAPKKTQDILYNNN